MASYRRYGNANPFNKNSNYCHRDRSDRCRGDSGHRPPTPPGPPAPGLPTTLREVLLSLVGERVTISVPFDDGLTGILVAVRDDYVVLVDSVTGDQLLIRIAKIELVREGGVI